MATKQGSKGPKSSNSQKTKRARAPKRAPKQLGLGYSDTSQERPSAIDGEAIGLVLLTFGAFFLVLLIPYIPTGFLGVSVRSSLIGRLGFAAFALPLPLIVVGILLFFRRSVAQWPRYLSSYLLLMFGLWLFLAIARPSITGTWGEAFHVIARSVLGWLAYAIGLFVFSLGLDAGRQKPWATLASRVMQQLLRFLIATFRWFMAQRKTWKQGANFQADISKVQQELNKLDKDLNALGSIHQGKEELENLATWRSDIKGLKMHLKHPSPRLLSQAQNSSKDWQALLKGLSQETAVMVSDRVRVEYISDFSELVPAIHSLLEHIFVGDNPSSKALEQKRRKLLEQLERKEHNYYKLQQDRDKALQLISQKAFEPLALEKLFTQHENRVAQLKVLADEYRQIGQEVEALHAWHLANEDILNLSHSYAEDEDFAQLLLELARDIKTTSPLNEAFYQEGHRRLREFEQPILMEEHTAALIEATQVASQEIAHYNESDIAPLNLDDIDPETTIEEIPINALASIPKQPKPDTGAIVEEKVSEPVAGQGRLELPDIALLEQNLTQHFQRQSSVSTLERTDIINTTIGNFKLSGEVQHSTLGPTVTRFAVRPGEGEKISRYTSLSDDIALSLGVASVRIEAPIQGQKDIIGLEVPNETREMVRFREAIESAAFAKESQSAASLPVVLGKSIEGDFWIRNLAKMPHLLIAGSTGSGKSVAVNALIVSLLYQFLATELRFVMIDPKMVELTPYDGIPHLLRPVVTNPDDAAGVLLGAVAHMERRYKMMSKIGAKSLEQYNQKAQEYDLPTMPYIAIIIDELADLMITSPKEVESAIMRLAQMARATGMHLILATQRPSVDILTSLIKVNVPARMAFAVSSGHDSRTILDTMGAERLTGQGDMLFYQPGLVKPIRLQGPLIGEGEIQAISAFLCKQTPFFDDEFVEAYGADFDPVPTDESTASGLIDWNDDKLREAAELVINEGQASVSRFQRRLGVGHARAGKLMDSLEALAIVGPHQGSKPREVLVTLEELANILGSKS